MGPGRRGEKARGGGRGEVEESVKRRVRGATIVHSRGGGGGDRAIMG